MCTRGEFMAKHARTKEFRRKRSLNNRRCMVAILVVLGLVFTVMMFGTFSLKKRQAVFQEKEEYYSVLLADEEKRAEELEEFEKYTKTNAYIEEVAKERFGLVKDGEIIFVAR